MSSFCHLHTHTAYSLLDGTANIQDLLLQAKVLGMDSLAITDHGNMFGVPHFVAAAHKQGIKPIIGCECYVATDMHDHKDKQRWHQILLARNAQGYHNLMQLCSLGFTEGYYYKPRIDKKHIKKYAAGLIATTCCLAAEVPRTIIEHGEEAGEKVFLEWLSIFGPHYYIELQRHGIPEQDLCNTILIKWAKKYGVKVIATNDVHYIRQEDSLAQDIMLCLQTGKDYNDPKRMRFANDQFFLKSPAQMQALFTDIPEAIDNTLAIAEQVEAINLSREILLPVFEVPAGFASQDSYLEHLTFEHAKQRYGTLSAAIEDRLRYELQVIASMRFAGYFLIVQDMVAAAKRLGVVVGPGRGSAAGSVVAFCLGITDVEPLHYNLLFERFLNPDRFSMPDFDIDVDDEGRQKVITYLAEKYGYNQVAHIITFGSMGPKSAIRDVARVLGLPLHTANELAKLVPERLGTTFKHAFAEVPELAALRNNPESAEGKVLTIAASLEGSPRHTGIHAAGVIIAPDNLINHIPVKRDKDTQLLVTQYDGSVVESVGMLKMDLLGLKTLSIIKDTVKLIEAVQGEQVDIHHLPLDDPKTFELYQKGNTVGIFQFESDGMRQSLVKLHPTHIEHLIAMNALYRPGPMDNIPSYIARMHGKEPVVYLHPLLERILASTYGLPVYQEQIMQLAQQVAGYTLGQADLLRRAMGKKKPEEMARQKAVFIAGAQAHHQIDPKIAAEIFETMEKFAQYGFNRSHAVAYTLLSFQTAYLKAHYPAAFMAAVLTHHQHNISKIAFFIEECTRMGLTVKGPDINESDVHFTNTDPTTIRFGLAAIKGNSTQMMELLTAYRKKHGPFPDIASVLRAFIELTPDKLPNKKTLEALAMAGAFDSFHKYHRKQYVTSQEGQPSYIEEVLRHTKSIQKTQNTAQQSLFAEPSFYYAKPEPPSCPPYSDLEKLLIEKELVGFYISGHPMQPYQVELHHFCNATTDNLLTLHNKEVRLAGMVTEAVHRQNKQGKPLAVFTLEDHKGTFEMRLMGEAYQKYHGLVQQGKFLYTKGVVKERFQQKDNWDFMLNTLEPLEQIRNKYVHSIQLRIPIETLTEEMVNSLHDIVLKHPGTCTLQCILLAKQYTVPLTSNTYKVAPDNQFFDKVQQLGISYAVNDAKSYEV